VVPFLIARAVKHHGRRAARGELRPATSSIRLGDGPRLSAEWPLGILAGVWFAMRSTAAAMALQAASTPSSRGCGRDDWAARRHARDQTKGATIVLAIFALVWNSVSWPARVCDGKAAREEKLALIFMILFPLVGLFLLAYAAIRKGLAGAEIRRVGGAGPERIPIQARPHVSAAEIEGARRLERPENGFQVAP